MFHFLQHRPKSLRLRRIEVCGEGKMGRGLSSTFEIPEVCQVEKPTPTQLTLCSLYKGAPIAMMCLGIFCKQQTNITIFLQ